MARRLSKSIHSPGHIKLRELLIAARKKAGRTQQEVADALGRPQAFVAKYECGERRLDVVEFLQVVEALSGDPARMIRALLTK